MPDNTWFTPYKFPAQKCLSLGPSQGIVYQLSEKTVVKMPFQYPVDGALHPVEAKEKMYMSLRSFAIFRRESSFYDVVAKRPHPNLAQRLQRKQCSCIVLQYFKPLELVWSHQTMDMRLAWIQQLLSALEWLEDLGYTHGDLKIHNMGIDDNNQLRLFDFGSIRHRDEEGFHEQTLEDHFSLATCIHFLASGVDHIAKANSLRDVRRTFSKLKGGQGVVDRAATDFKKVIQAGWTGDPRSASSFSQVRKSVADIIRQISNDGVYQSKDLSASSQLACDEMVMEEDTRWMDEKEYCAAWTAKGFQTPDDIWS